MRTDTDLKVVQPQQQFEIGSLLVMPFELVHDVTNYGYLVASRETGEKAGLYHRYGLLQILLFWSYAHHD